MWGRTSCTHICTQSPHIIPSRSLTASNLRSGLISQNSWICLCGCTGTLGGRSRHNLAHNTNCVVLFHWEYILLIFVEFLEIFDIHELNFLHAWIHDNPVSDWIIGNVKWTADRISIPEKVHEMTSILMQSEIIFHAVKMICCEASA